MTVLREECDPNVAIRVGFSALLVLAGIIGVAAMTQQVLGLSPLFPYHVGWIFGPAGALVAVLAGQYLQTRYFGVANHVTLMRGAMTAVLIALAGESATSAAAWCAVVTAGCVLALDGVDGWLARRLGEATDFGARFDMETDALFILAASWMVWHSGTAGPWILASGLMRYLFVAASWILPWMTRPLPFSQRRRIIFVTQALALILCLVPTIAPTITYGIALVSVLVLIGSFLTDVVWLARN